MPKNKASSLLPTPAPAKRLLITSVQSLEFQTLEHGGHPEVTFLPVKYKHNKIAHSLLHPAPLEGVPKPQLHVLMCDAKFYF